jgi:hypothetical protein
MDIPANSPLQVEAVEAKTFDKWVVDRLQFSGDGVTQPLSGEAFFKLGRKNEDGTWEFHPGTIKNLYIPDVWAKAVEDQEVATVMQSMIVLLTRLGTESGIL